MVNFSSINFDNISLGLPFGIKRGNNIIDVYNDLSEKKDEYIAVSLANDNNSIKRAPATVIAANAAIMFALAKVGINIARSGKPYENKILDWFLNGVNYYTKFMKKHNIGKTPLETKIMGIATYILASGITGATLGGLLDWYNATKHTIINGKISNTKSGVEGSWISSGLKSLSANEQGQQIIRDSIRKNPDKTITVKFKGINREYTITKKELKNASRAYVTYTDGEGKVTGFKKKFSKGDGDTLAFELAYEKYCNEVNDGIVSPDKNLSVSTQKISDSGDILYTEGSVNHLYYLLTGNKGEKYNTEKITNDSIDKMYARVNINNFINDYSKNSEKYSAEIELKSNDKNQIIIKDKYHALHRLPTDKKYTISKMNAKYVTLSNSEKTKETIQIPVDKLKNYIASVNYINHDFDK